MGGASERADDATGLRPAWVSSVVGERGNDSPHGWRQLVDCTVPLEILS